MASCPTCGKTGRGLRGHVLERRCEICHRSGCDKCLPLQRVTQTWPIKGTFTNTIYGQGQLGTCSATCYQEYWKREVSADPHRVRQIPYAGLHTPEVFDANILYMVLNTKKPTADTIQMLSMYPKRPLAQGLIIMYNGHKDLDHSMITDGLRLCRNDPTYESIARGWVDNLATTYVAELKRLDVPTNRANLGGVQISLSVPRNQNQMKLHQCPSCSAAMDQVAFRGQVVKCPFCGSTFEIT
jgi:hypothetical protein